MMALISNNVIFTSLHFHFIVAVINTILRHSCWETSEMLANISHGYRGRSAGRRNGMAEDIIQHRGKSENINHFVSRTSNSSDIAKLKSP